MGGAWWLGFCLRKPEIKNQPRNPRTARKAAQTKKLILWIREKNEVGEVGAYHKKAAKLLRIFESAAEVFISFIAENAA
jgi:hypothetical protein